jgi:cytochrome c peroxidase
MIHKKRRKEMRNFFLMKFFAVASLLLMTSSLEAALSDQELLGQFLYFDENLSEPAGQSCASCHLPESFFVDPDKGPPVSEGVIPGLFGSRNSPMSAYAMYSPTRYFDTDEGLWIGGQFWDSRATGDVLGDPLADQALGPFLNPVELANISEETVVRDAQSGAYGDLFISVCSDDNNPVDLGDKTAVLAAYDCIALSIAAFERTQLFGQFNSKYDRYLAACIAASGDMDACAKGAGPIAEATGTKIFSKKEWDGLQLFMNEINNNNGTLDPGEGAMCVLCHVADWTKAADYDIPVQVPAWAPEGMVPPLFTDFTYDNLGVPKSDDKRLANLPVDNGLGAIVGEDAENGKFKVMTLRNVGKTKPYAHNGFFKSLKDITHFYNTRDVVEEAWPAPEVPDTVNFEELGNLGLSEKDEAALVEFMKTLSDPPSTSP